MNRLSFRCAHRFAGGFALDAAFETDAQVTALFGPSGSGKTSILYMIAGLLRPREGAIALGKQIWLDTRRGIDTRPERRRVGFVLQDHLLFPHLSVERNLTYGLRRRRGENSAIEASRVIEVLELGDLLARYPRNLSGGEKQRVALGRSLLSGPQLLLMDEPLAALDAPLKDRVLSYLERVVEEWHVPTIYVSHNASEVRRLAERVIMLERGRVVHSGSADELLLEGYSPSGDWEA
ncbi:MAG: molybdenum ABC transporter ATP-binding protein [Planctomycetota bacterium]|nr:MAG: molybdenum ABC transporter ATP-binding protein [Planctomycetota bacterium]